MKSLLVKLKSKMIKINRGFSSQDTVSEEYLTYNEDKLMLYYNKKRKLIIKKEKITGFADKEGTFEFSKKNPLSKK